jgi:hypothetical protein
MNFWGEKNASQFTQGKCFLRVLIQKEKVKSKIEHFPSIEFRRIEMVTDAVA